LTDWTGGQIKNDDSADDVKHVDLTQARVCGADPLSAPPRAMAA